MQFLAHVSRYKLARAKVWCATVVRHADVHTAVDQLATGSWPRESVVRQTAVRLARRGGVGGGYT